MYNQNDNIYVLSLGKLSEQLPKSLSVGLNYLVEPQLGKTDLRFSFSSAPPCPFFFYVWGFHQLNFFVCVHKDLLMSLHFGGQDWQFEVNFMSPSLRTSSVSVTKHSFFLSFFFWLRHTACGILFPRPGIEPVSPSMEARSLNHWIAREVPKTQFLYQVSCFGVGSRRLRRKGFASFQCFKKFFNLAGS